MFYVTSALVLLQNRVHVPLLLRLQVVCVLPKEKLHIPFPFFLPFGCI